MGLENRIVYNLVDVVEGNCRMKQALIKRQKDIRTCFYFPLCPDQGQVFRVPGQMKKLVDDLREEFDFILLDCPAGIEQGFKNAIAGADRAFVVTTPEVSAIRDADRIIGLLEASEITKTDLIVNRIRMDMVRRGDMMSIEDVTDILGDPDPGSHSRRRPDRRFHQPGRADRRHEPICGTGLPLNICRRVLGQEVPLMDLEKSRGIFSRFQGFLKRA